MKNIILSLLLLSPLAGAQSLTPLVPANTTPPKFCDPDWMPDTVVPSCTPPYVMYYPCLYDCLDLYNGVVDAVKAYYCHLFNNILDLLQQDLATADMMEAGCMDSFDPYTCWVEAQQFRTQAINGFNNAREDLENGFDDVMAEAQLGLSECVEDCCYLPNPDPPTPYPPDQDD